MSCNGRISSASSDSIGLSESIEEKQVSANDFQVIKLIGSGGFGKVYLARNKANGFKVAIKICEKRKISKDKMDIWAFYEFFHHSQAHHPYIIKLLSYFHDENMIYFVLEYAENKTLLHRMRQEKSKRFDNFLAAKYTFQLANALQYCHDLGFFHGDLKPENVLVDVHGNAKLTDFGLSWPIHRSPHTTRGFYHGTLEYMAPELFNKQSYDEKIDHWSLGVMCYEFLVGRTPFYSKREDLIKKKILEVKITFTKDVTDGARDLIINLLMLESKSRLSLEHVMTHQWIKHN